MPYMVFLIQVFFSENKYSANYQDIKNENNDYNKIKQVTIFTYKTKLTPKYIVNREPIPVHFHDLKQPLF